MGGLGSPCACSLIGAVSYFLVLRLPDVERFSLQLEVVLDEHPVVKHRNAGRCLHAAVRIEGRGHPDDVVGLPLAWFLRGVHQRNALLVDARGLSVRVGLVLERIEDLQLVPPVAAAAGGQEDPAVAARLPGTGDAVRNPPLDVQLVILEAPLRFDVAGRLVHRQDAVGDRPARRGLVLRGHPLVEVLAVEEDDRVGGRCAGGGARCHDAGDRVPDLRVLGLGLSCRGGGRRGALRCGRLCPGALGQRTGEGQRGERSKLRMHC